MDNEESNSRVIGMLQEVWYNIIKMVWYSFTEASVSLPRFNVGYWILELM